MDEVPLFSKGRIHETFIENEIQLGRAEKKLVLWWSQYSFSSSLFHKDQKLPLKVGLKQIRDSKLVKQGN